jgi:hypothetical protein
MGFGSDVSTALRRERLHAADACFSADIAKLIDFIIAFRSTAGFAPITNQSPMRGNVGSRERLGGGCQCRNAASSRSDATLRIGSTLGSVVSETDRVVQ